MREVGLRRVPRWVCAAMTGLLLVGLPGCGADQQEPVTVGLITKQENYPYWITMREIAQRTADGEGVTLVTATGTSDVDVDSQVVAIEAMVDRGVDGILIAPTDSTKVVPAIEAARAAGVTVIAVDTDVEPPTAVDAFFGTDNHRAGLLIGQYAAARAEQLGLDPQIAILDLAPGISSGELRKEGFFEGYGISADDPAVVGSVDTEGDQELGRVGMEKLLAANPGINVVYSVNDPAALGALEAFSEAGTDLSKVVLVSVDGGCEAIKGPVRSGDIDATAQQYPENMARLGVTAIAEAVRGGESPSGTVNTGVELITGSPAPGVTSRDVAFGVRNCWGD